MPARLSTTLVLVLALASSACGGGSTSQSPDMAVDCVGGTLRTCGGACVDTATDRAHCGGCNRACTDGWHCVAGACRLDCATGLTACEVDGRCVDTSNDPDHCGSCGTVCVAPELCLAGKCSINCGPGGDGGGGGDGGTSTLTPCHRACVNILNDRNNCGGCDLPCPADNACVNGQCQQVCPLGQTNCGGRCTAVLSDPDNCGSCGNTCRAPNNVCSNGQCTDSCRQGLRQCGQAGRCVNVAYDPDNCGACGKPCPQGQVCGNGRCAGSCGPGLVPCAGGCINPYNDSGNCGGCGLACAVAKVCVRGVCANSCPVGQSSFSDCGGVCADTSSDSGNCGACGVACDAQQVCFKGRCINQGDCALMNLLVCGTTCRDVASDPSNCGGCGKACAPVANGTPVCALGQCRAQCNPNFGDCDATYANGCETDLRSAVLHCGMCGAACSQMNFNPMCVNGKCAGACVAPNADCDGNLGNGCEIDLNTDAANCGACGRTCSSNNVMPKCTGGQCSGACAVGFADCDSNLASNGCEVNLNTDPDRCGACNNSTCSGDHIPLRTCANGICIGACAPGFADCDGNKKLNGCETDIATGLANCGGCLRTCSTDHVVGAACAAGDCQGTCAPNFGDCNNDLRKDGCETSLLSSPDHCGACLKSACSKFHVPVPTCTNGVCDGACEDGWVNCDNTMLANGCNVDVKTDVNNCGACKKVCSAVANTQVDCQAGVCVVGSCKLGFADCNNKFADGCEVNVNTDVANCGGCGKACGALANAIVKCSSGACDIAACNAGFANCDGVAASGCEQAVSGDTNNCGGCGIKCPARANADTTCTNGVCGYTCKANFGDCDNDPATGCETDITASPKHCGGCGLGCPSGQNSQATCANRVCGFQCVAPFLQCQGAGQSIDCETNVNSNVNNCGGCGNACPAVANAAASCGSGKCGYNCNVGFADCNGLSQDGCEVNTQTSTANCGTCGISCAVPANAVATCTAGVCGFTCNNNFADCDKDPGNGCEVNLQTSVANCSSCGKVCTVPANAVATCSGGTCGFTCNAGFANCDNNANNGCEINTNTSVGNCGSCGKACNAPANSVATCASGTCGFTCNVGFGNCDNDDNNGCETNTNTSVGNCGSCGKACTVPANATATCSGGTCGFTCSGAFADCNKDASDGCEINTDTDDANCGSCGKACAMGQKCTKGTCA